MPSLFLLLNKKQKIWFLGIFLINFCAAIAEAATLAGIYYFIGLLTDGGQLKQVFSLSTSGSIPNIAAILFGLIIFSTALRYASNAIIYLYSFGFESEMTRKILTKNFSVDYYVATKRTKDQLTKYVLSHLPQIVHMGILPALNLISNYTTTLAIILVSFVTIGPDGLKYILPITGFFIVFYYAARRFIKMKGLERDLNDTLRNKKIHELLQNYKQNYIFNLIHNYVESVSTYSRHFHKSKAATIIAAQTPRYVMEFLIYSLGIFAVSFALAEGGGDLPALGMLAFASIRLVPSVQQIFFNTTQIKSSESLVLGLSKFLSSSCPELNRLKIPKDWGEVVLRDVFIAPSKSKAQSHRASLPKIRIREGHIIGLWGRSGIGKSTLLDSIAGLTPTVARSVDIDGKTTPLFSNSMMDWEDTIIGYVPSESTLVEGGLVENITMSDGRLAIGDPRLKNLIDTLDLGHLRRAQLNRVSAGELQRIAIARALYLEPRVLLLDEPTSSLDGRCEENVVNLIKKMSSKIAVILVTHRPKPLTICNEVINMNDFV
jgi:ABC-type transport system involved in cytochrome bd biosynthesis fused ATPase/permease subunit